MFARSRLLRQLVNNPDLSEIGKFLGNPQLQAQGNLFNKEIPPNPTYNPVIEPTNPNDGTGRLLRGTAPVQNEPINYGQGRIIDADAQSQMPIASNDEVPPPSQRLLRQYPTTEEIRNQIGALEQQPVKREESFWKRFGSGVVRGLESWDPNTGIGGLVGATLTGGIGSAASPNFNGRLNQNAQKQRLLRQLGEVQQMEDWKTANDKKKAETQTIFNDDARQKEQNEWNRQYRYDKLQSDAENKQYAQQNQNLRAFNKLQYFDPNRADHLALAKSAKLNPDELKGWDNRNPIAPVIAGIQYKYNRENGKFEPTGISDTSKELVDFTVTDDEGKTFTYKVPAEKAASFQNQQQMLGKRVELAKALQANQLSFNADQKEKDRDLRRETLNFNKQKFAEIMKQRDAAMRVRNENEVRRLDLMMQKARAGMMSDGFSQEELNEIFGSN